MRAPSNPKLRLLQTMILSANLNGQWYLTEADDVTRLNTVDWTHQSHCISWLMLTSFSGVDTLALIQHQWNVHYGRCQFLAIPCCALKTGLNHSSLDDQATPSFPYSFHTASRWHC